MPTGRTVVAVNGSERLGGNTSQVLRGLGPVFAERGVRLDVVDLVALDIGRCGPCGDCNARPDPCVQRDDAAGVVARMAAADGIIYACPVHGFGTATLMQQFIERAGVGYLRFERPLTNKVAGVIVTGRRYAHMDVYAQLLHNVLLNRMVLVGSGYPAVVHAGAPGDAGGDAEGMDAVLRMAHRMIDMIDLLAHHRELTGAELGTPVSTERVAL